jgi:hypothetical protein
VGGGEGAALCVCFFGGAGVGGEATVHDHHTVLSVLFHVFEKPDILQHAGCPRGVPVVTLNVL